MIIQGSVICACVFCRPLPPLISFLLLWWCQVADAVESLQDAFADVDLLVASNLRRVLTAFRNARVGRHVSPSKPVLSWLLPGLLREAHQEMCNSMTS